MTTSSKPTRPAESSPAGAQPAESSPAGAQPGRTELPYRSIPEMFFRRVEATPDARAFGYPGPDGAPVWMPWAEVARRATAIAAGLRGLGVARENRVAIMATTRLEWVLADLGIMCAGGATTTVYPNTDTEDASFIVRDSGARVLIAEDAALAARVTGDLPDLTHVVLIDEEPPDGAAPDGRARLSLAQLERDGAAALADTPDLVREVVATVEPEHLATLIYTSGTTGRPKGVELLHRGWVWCGVTQGQPGMMDPEDVHLLWLPLAHSFGKTLLCGVINVGVTTYVDGRIDKIVDNLATIRPTLMCGAPRIFEKVHNRVVTSASHGVKGKIFAWALRIGRAKVAREQAGRPVGPGLALRYRLATTLVFGKIHARLGGRMRKMISGSAPLARDIATFFAAAGIPIQEGYGLTEACAGNFVNRSGRVRIGTAGPAIGDLECRIAEDGEILLRGAPVMRGYHGLPEETEATLGPDGWLHTGDIGELGPGGYLTITDRKKDLVKTAGGKYLAPSAIEGAFKAVLPYASQAVVVAHGRHFPSLLVTLDPDALPEWAAGGPLAGRPYPELVASAEAEALVAGAVERLNSRLNRWETIKKFAILPRDLTVADGELTPSMKVRRARVEQNFAAVIDELYAGAVAPG